MSPGNITIKSVLGHSQTLPCAGPNVAINGVSKYYTLGMSDRIGSKLVILVCDIGVKDHSHFYDIVCDFKHEPGQVKLTRAQSKNLQADKTNRQQQELHDGASPTPLSMLSNITELTVETNHPSSAISCASTFKLHSSTSSTFISSECTTSSECSATLSSSQNSSASDNTALNCDITSSVVNESNTSGCDGVAAPNALSNCTAETMFDIPLAKLNLV